MVQYSSNGTQTVRPGGFIIFDDAVVVGDTPVVHREGSGLFTLPSVGCACMGTGYKLDFSGNISFPATAPTGETAATAPISVAMAIGGEADSTTEMIAIPAAADDFVNVGRNTIVSTIRGCCASVGIQNVSNGTISVNNPILLIDTEGGVA